MQIKTRAYLIASVLLVAIASTGCGDDIDQDDIDTAIDEGQARGADLSVMADEEIGPRDEATSMAMAAEIMLAIDEGEVLVAEEMLDRCDEPAVCDYAARMINEHLAHAQMVDALIARFGQLPLDNDVAEELRDQADEDLRLIENTIEPDVVYMQLQVSMHETAIVLVGNLELYIDDVEFDQFLVDSQVLYDVHSIDAQEILRGL